MIIRCITFYLVNQKVATLAGALIIKGCPMATKNDPNTTKKKLVLTNNSMAHPIVKIALPIITPILIPFVSKI
jgi:hypothetical protein